MEFKSVTSSHSNTGGGLGDDESLVQSIVFNLMDSQPQNDEDKNFVFYFAELNANHHLVISYLKTFIKTKQLLSKIKDIVIHEETRAMKIHGMTINVLHMCIVSLDPQLSIGMLDDDGLIDILCHFASLTKYYSPAIDIMRFALSHNVITLEKIVAVLHKEYFSTIAASVAKEAKGSPVRRVPSANFYALLRLLLHKPNPQVASQSLSSSLSSSSGSPNLMSLEPMPTLSSVEIAGLGNNLECLRLVKNLCAFVEVDHRIHYPIDGMIAGFHTTVEKLKTLLTSGTREPLHLQILWLNMRKLVEVLNILLDLNYLEKDFSTRCLKWGILEAAHGAVGVLNENCPAIIEGLRQAATKDVVKEGSEGRVQTDKTKPATDQLESACLLADLIETLNAVVLSTIALGNELMIASPVVFSKLSVLYLSKNVFFPTVLELFKKIGETAFNLDNCEILREMSKFLSYAQCSNLSKAERVALFDASLQGIWDCCLAHLNSYCDRCIAGTDDLDGSICRGIMAVSTSFGILSNLEFVKPDDLPSWKLAAQQPSFSSVSSQLASTALTQQVVSNCFKLFRDVNKTGQDRCGWLHWIADCIHNIWAVKRYVEFSQVPVMRLPDALISACQEISPENSALLLQDKSLETAKLASDSLKDIEILERTKKQIEADTIVSQLEQEASKGHLQRKLAQYTKSSGNSINNISSTSINSSSSLSNSSSSGISRITSMSGISSTIQSEQERDKSSSSTTSPNNTNNNTYPYLILSSDKIIGKDQLYIEANLERLYVNLLLTPTAFYDRFGIDKSNIDSFAQTLLTISQKGLMLTPGPFDPSFIEMRNSLLAIRLLTVVVAHYNLELALQGKICQFCIENLVQRFVKLGHEPWHYRPVYSLLLVLSRHDRQAKRQVVKNLSTLEYQFDRAMRSNALLSILLLMDESVEFLLRIDDAGEEVVACYCLRTIQLHHLPRLQAYTFKIIAGVGEFHPGIIHKGIGRREAEDVCYRFLTEALWSTMEELFYLLKASTTCLRDVNVKPKWFSRTYLYNWRAYQRGLADRPLLQASMVRLLSKMVVSGGGHFVVPVYSQALSLSTALMCNCTDGLISSFLMSAKGGRKSQRDTNQYSSNLRDDLLSLMLVYFARALYLVNKLDNVKERDINYNMSLSITSNTARKVRQDSKDDSNIGRRFSVQNLSEKLKLGGNETSSSNSSSNDNSSSSSSGGGSSPSSARPQSVTKPKTSFNRAVELLAETTVDAIFSFLCLEEMFPLSAYLRNLSTFNRVPVIASVSSIMIRFPSNNIIQKRGLDLFKAFANNNLELSSIAMHASPAIVVAMACLTSDSACQLAYTAIITALQSADDFAIENVIRFGAHVQIFTLVSKSTNLNVAVGACCSITAICKSGEIADLVCQELNFTSAVVEFLGRWPKDKRVQVEGFKALLALSKSADIAVNIYKQPGHLSQYKKTHKYIQDLVKADKLAPEYSKSDIQEILLVSTKKEKCTIS